MAYQLVVRRMRIRQLAWGIRCHAHVHRAGHQLGEAYRLGSQRTCQCQRERHSRTELELLHWGQRHH